MKTPFAIISILIVLLVLEAVIDPNVIPQLRDVKDTFSTWSIIIFNFAAITGAISMVSTHTQKIAMKGDTTAKYYSGLLLAGFAITILIALFAGSESNLYSLYYVATNQTVSSVVGGALGFVFISMGAYRAFRVNSMEALVLFIGGISFILMEMPIIIALFPPIAPIGDWILRILGGSSYKAGIITAAAGALTVAIRMILQKERSALQ